MTKEVTVLAEFDFRQNGDGLLTAGHIALRGSVIQGLHRAQGDLHVMLQLVTAFLQQPLAGFLDFLGCQVLQHPGGGATEDHRKQHHGNQCQQHDFCF